MPEEKNNKEISVLMSVYNEKEAFLRRSIESTLHQTINDFEFIIVDDGSSKKSCKDVLREYAQKDSRIKIIRNEKNLGLTKSLNKGVAVANGKYIARIDSDDIADLHRLEKQLRFMQENNECALCGTWAYIIDENDDITGKKKFYINPDEIKKKILFFNFFTHSSLFFKKEVVLKIGAYSKKIEKAQDYDLILKISAKHPIANIPEFLCFHRVRHGSISSETKKRQEWYAIIARWRAIFIYGFPKIYIFKIIPALLYFLFIPYFIEKIIIKFQWKS